MTREKITRRNLPHWYVPGAAHFLTFRLAGTLPREIIDQLKQRKTELLNGTVPPQLTRAEYRERVHKQLFAAYDDYLDADRNVEWLGDSRVAAAVRASLYYLHGGKYGLMAYCIMPNHVHALLLPFDGASPSRSGELSAEVGECADKFSPLCTIMHSLKGYTAHEANRVLRRSGAFWQHESYDHWVRDEDELERVVQYINANPVRAKLASEPHEWYWCSAHDRYLLDGDRSGWLLEQATPGLTTLSTSEDACATRT